MAKSKNAGDKVIPNANEVKQDALEAISEIDDIENEDSSNGDAEADLNDLNASVDADGSQQISTESYGTGVREVPGYVVDENNFYDDDRQYNEASPTLTGGDIDTNYEQANAVGDESVGGTAPTPDMDIVDNLGRAVGLEMNDANFLHTEEILQQRDDRRWEMEPRSSEDYEERRADLDED